MSSRSIRQASVLRRSSLALALAMGMGLTGNVFAQATTGSLFGSAEAGDTVQITSGTGVTRSTTVGENGRYNFNNLPLGVYKVSLIKGGTTVDSRDKVELRVNAGTDVSFNSAANASGAQNLDAVTVTGTALPAIDVSSVDSRTVITRSQLDQLPLGRSAESIALLAPGVTPGATGTGFASPTGQALVSFGGSSITENAYYVNGMNTTDPISGYGGIVLPYGAIDQQEVLTGGYGAAYGRSDGGVISIVGRRGTNDWKFGGQILYTPRWGKADPKNWRYAADSVNAGELNRYRKNNKDWDAIVSAYGGGALIKDKLFIFAAVEAEKREGTNVYSVNTGQQANYTYKDPKTYVKLDWNINDNNLLEFTHASYKNDYAGTLYDYDYDTLSRGDYVSRDTAESTKQTMWVGKFTSYITDDLTLTAQYGRQNTDFYTHADGDANLIHIIQPSRQNPLYKGGNPGGYSNALGYTTVGDPRKNSKGSNYRVDLNYKIGNHEISAGIDNQSTQDNNDGDSIYSNSGYAWEYAIAQPGAALAGGEVVGTPSGYYVDKYRYSTVASVAVKQRAQYIEDKWQVTDRVLLSLGLRNDQFRNYNGSGQAYITQHAPQWAPRLGGTWDVFGDSTFKVYGNAGRYYLALPNQPALRGASGSYYTRSYYSYDGVDPTTGYPINPQPLAGSKGPNGEYSANNEFGQSPDPRTVTAKGIKPEYQDEYILGFDKTLGDDWVYGAKLTYRKLKNAIDDFCATDRVIAKSAAIGNDVANENWDAISCYLFNPGRSNTFQVPNLATGGLDQIKTSNADLGFPHLKRSYYAVNLHMEHPQGNGNWWGRIDYVYSKSYGNSEGQVDSDAGTRSAPSVTQAWDNPEVMAYSNGLLPNDHKHQLKLFGSYQFTPEWSVAGNLQILSGAPRNCYGGYGPDQIEANANYGVESYHFCGGLPSPPGDAGRTPWTKSLTLSTQYRPAFADHKLALSLEVFNVTNEQKNTQVSPYYGVSSSPNNEYNLPLATQTPRYIRLGATYDF
ncbi:MULTISPECIES: TonB-dependent receptor [Rhodanobacteraceae]|uniref:TonB-dependent receptor n=1 Tax=Rhodanobacteraceae TaxID=1775411 RepID=UPI0008909940|nr:MULTISPECIES: TonB-dependent receptor [Rhodanobacteraceae]SDG94687.1 TonB-dependent Receptor Plug Domain [Dyella sp. 333MFSha]SKB99737.1 Outer membrane receptor proteins, mostly Fe transport [Luteibacter sp. 22Crub2.1]